MSGAARGGPEKKWGPTASDRAGKGRSQGKGGPEFPDSGRKGGSQPRRTSAPPEAGRKRGREGALSLHARNKGGSIPERSRQSLGKAPKGWFIGETGLRPLWKGLAVLAGGWLVSLGVGLGLTAAMNSLYQVWGVNQDNILRAPIWIQLISGHWGEWVSIAQNLLLLPLAWVLCRWNRKEGLPWGRSGGKGFVLGAGFALALAALLLLADGLRWQVTSSMPAGGRPAFPWAARCSAGGTGPDAPPPGPGRCRRCPAPQRRRTVPAPGPLWPRCAPPLRPDYRAGPSSPACPGRA